MKMINDLCYKMSPELIKAIYKKAYELDATIVVINKAKWNYADVAMFENEDCIDWNISISC